MAVKDPSRGTGAYKKNVQPKTVNQGIALDTMRANDISMISGPAGTGKTYLAIAEAVQNYMAGVVARIILVRPAVEAGERLGFMPGGIGEKMDPYMRPLYDALLERISPQQLQSMIANMTIEIVPLAFMRGRNLAKAYIVVDEAQNATRGQLRMAMTRLAAGSKMVLTGDPTQCDIEPEDSGFADLTNLLDGTVEGVGVARLTDVDVVRHPTVRRLLAVISPTMEPAPVVELKPKATEAA